MQHPAQHKFLPCADQEGGVEIAIHAAREIFQMESTEAVLLIDAENANRLNRHTALLNIRHICPKISTYLFNTYLLPARFILGEGVEILSQEGTTQGDNFAMAFYALSLKKLLVSLNKIGCHQEWFADDAGGLGKLVQLRECFDLLISIGPKLRVFSETVEMLVSNKKRGSPRASQAGL